MKKDLRILISNDDGVYAPGIKILEEIACQLTDDVWVVAPAQEQSGAAHSLTLHYPIRSRQLGPKKFAVEGTPTDCVLLAVKALLTDKKPDLVLSGVNNSANVADDVTYSGTIAAAMEGTLLGISSIAFSQCAGINESIHWNTALTHLPELIKKLWGSTWPKEVLFNVNLPNVLPDQVKGINVTQQGLRPDYKCLVKSLDPRNNPCYWVGPVLEAPTCGPETDLMAIQEEKISVTPLHLNLTHYETLEALKKTFD